MTTLYEGAFAKINLTLDVLGKRADGYHDLQSVMQTISIRDDMEIDVGTGKPWRLLCSVDGIPTDEKNLAWKAAKVYCDAMDKDPEGLEIRIVKRIPAGAGLGGGSADAAAVLRALNRHYGDPLSVLALAELGAQVGKGIAPPVKGYRPRCTAQHHQPEPHQREYQHQKRQVHGRQRPQRCPVPPACQGSQFHVVTPSFTIVRHAAVGYTDIIVTLCISCTLAHPLRRFAPAPPKGELLTKS